MIKTDAHMHTWFSSDSESDPKDMAEAAIKKGFQAICFTDHYDKNSFDWGPEDVFEPEEYFSYMLKLQEEYKDKIDIRIGVEIGLRPELHEYYQKFIPSFPFDFVIGSAHCVFGHDPASKIPFQDHTDDEIYRQIFKEMKYEAETTNEFDVMGHLDYVIRYGENGAKEFSYYKYKEEIDALLKVLVEKGKGIEINTSGFKYGLGSAHPNIDILKKYKELGGEIITIGADAHKPEHIGYDFYRVKDILQSCGFGYYAEFKQRIPKFCKIT